MIQSQNKTPAQLVWWLLWATTMAGLVMIYFMLQPTGSQSVSRSLRFLPVISLGAAVILRWIVLPMVPNAAALPAFVVGLALAEGCGILGILMVPDLRNVYFGLSLAGLAQFAPLFVSREKGS